MPTTVKFLGGATLTATLTDIYTVPSNTTTRLEHLIISNGATAGTVTVTFYDASTTTGYELLNGVALSTNGVLEIANVILETGDKIKALSATTTGAKITLFGQEQS